MRYPTWTHSLSACLLIFAFGIQSKAIPPLSSKPNSLPAGLPRKFKSAAAQKYAVPSRLPLIDFSLPESYAGLMKLTDKPEDNQQLFFWLMSAENPTGAQTLALWSNGGPGCSSMMGALQENGPIMWGEGSSQASKNPFSWTTAANMLYIEHPNNVGFSTGTNIINNESQVAEYIFNFLTNFLIIFPEFNGVNFYLTGESYAGRYLSYTASLIYARKKELELKLQGILFVDPVLTNDIYQEDATVYPFVKLHQDVFKFKAPFMKDLEKTYIDCGYADLVNKFLKYPPPGPFPSLENPRVQRPKCQMWDTMFNKLPPTFDVYNINHKHGGPDPLFSINSQPTYFDRPDVRKALNVESKAPWTRCSDSKTIFPNGDFSAIPSDKVLPEIIEKGVKTIIAHGDLDGRLLIEGMQLGLQGMSWGGKQGFQEPLTKNLVIDGKVKGQWQTERKLSFVKVFKSGHMIPHDQPEVALNIFKYLVGARESL